MVWQLFNIDPLASWRVVCRTPGEASTFWPACISILQMGTPRSGILQKAVNYCNAAEKTHSSLLPIHANVTGLLQSCVIGWKIALLLLHSHRGIFYIAIMG